MRISITVLGIVLVAWLALPATGTSAPPAGSPNALGANPNSLNSPNSPNPPNSTLPKPNSPAANRLQGKPKGARLNSTRRVPIHPPNTANANLTNQQLQESEDRKSKAEKALSDLMKKSKDTEDSATKNLK